MNKIVGVSISLTLMLVACALATTETSNPISQTSPETSKPNHLCEKVPEPELLQGNNSDSIYLASKFYLCTYDGSQITFDFDNGDLGDVESVASDIILVVSGANIDNRSFYYIRETDNSYVAVSESTLPTKDYCKNQVTSINRLTLVLGSVGTTGCVLTNVGRLAYFQVEQLNPFGLESIKVSFSTWE
jgi:hypothetical protein